MKSKKKIGILGGTFDPIHEGHLNLATELKNKHALDEVWFIPTHVNPLKKNGLSANPEDRLAMVKLAIEPFPHFFVKDLELKRPPPSYTVDTLKILKQEHPEYDYFLLLGEDAAAHFDQWHQPEEIIKLTRILVGSRPGQWLGSTKNKMLDEALAMGMTPIHEMDIQATDLRVCLAKKLSCKNLIPAAVLQYIQQHHLYFPLHN